MGEVAGGYIPGCANCGSSDVKAHCPSPTCTWAKCRECQAVTGIVRGQMRAVGGARTEG